MLRKLINKIYKMRNPRLFGYNSEKVWYYILNNFYNTDGADKNVSICKSELTDELRAVFPYYKGSFACRREGSTLIFVIEHDSRLKRELEFLLSNPPLYDLDNKDYEFKVSYGLPRSNKRRNNRRSINEE